MAFLFDNVPAINHVKVAIADSNAKKLATYLPQIKMSKYPYLLTDAYNAHAKPEIYRLLLRHGAQLWDTLDFKGEPWETVFQNFKFGDPDAADQDGVTNLMIAATTAPASKPVIVSPNRVTDRLLCLANYLMRDADIDQTDDDGKTALDYARAQGSATSVQLLENAQTIQTNLQISPPVLFRPLFHTVDDMKYILNFPQAYQKETNRAGDDLLRDGAGNSFLFISDEDEDIQNPPTEYLDHFFVLRLHPIEYYVMEYTPQE